MSSWLLHKLSTGLCHLLPNRFRRFHKTVDCRFYTLYRTKPRSLRIVLMRLRLLGLCILRKSSSPFVCIEDSSDQYIEVMCIYWCCFPHILRHSFRKCYSCQSYTYHNYLQCMTGIKHFCSHIHFYIDHK